MSETAQNATADTSRQGTGGEVRTVSIDELTPDSANVRKHTERNSELIQSSLRQFGAGRSLVMDSSGVIRAGNGTLDAAKAVGIDKARIIESDGSELIVVKRTDLNGSQATAYAIADNRAGDLAEWHLEDLDKQLAALSAEGFEMDSLGFGELDDFEFDDGGGSGSVEDSEDDEPVGMDRAEELRGEWGTNAGELWEIAGENHTHRLLIGDCRNAEHVGQLIDASVNIAFTSPPYASQRKYDEESGFKPIHPDDFVDWFEPVQATVAEHLADDGSWFVNIKEHCDDGQRSLYVKDLTIAHVRQWGWRFVDELCWRNTKNGVPGKWSTRLKNAWEPVFQFSKGETQIRHDSITYDSESVMQYSADNASSDLTGFTGDAVRKPGKALPSNVIEVAAATGNSTHEAPFPVGLPSFFIRAYTDESDNVYDPFLGSGTTMLAAERLNRRCYGMELSPKYSAVILQRMHDADCHCRKVEK